MGVRSTGIELIPSKRRLNKFNAVRIKPGLRFHVLARPLNGAGLTVQVVWCVALLVTYDHRFRLHFGRLWIGLRGTVLCHRDARVFRLRRMRCFCEGLPGLEFHRFFFGGYRTLILNGMTPR
jgi:hypothetical protein